MCHCRTIPSDLPDENRVTTSLHPYGYLQSLPDSSTSRDIRYRPALAFLNTISTSNSICEDIHPLFQQSQWLNLSFEDFLRLRPALIVASRITRQECFTPFYSHVLHGKLKYLAEKQRHHLDQSSYETTKVAHMCTTETLDEVLPRYLRLEFNRLDENGNQYDAMTLFGTSLNSCDALYDPRIKLRRHHLYALRHVLEHGSLYDEEAVYLRIAIAICHEVVHAVWYHCSSTENPPSPATTREEPFYQLADASPKLGHAWEHCAFGATIWTIDYPGKITTYYHQLDAKTGRSDENIRIIVPRCWIGAVFLEPIWTYFSRLYSEGRLRLPTELESGCAFRKHSPEPSVDWTMIHGVKQEQACMMTRTVPFLFWNLLRPALECLEKYKKLGGCDREQYEEACGLLVDQAAASA